MNFWEKSALWEYHFKLWLIHHWIIYLAFMGGLIIFSVVYAWKEIRK